MKRSEIKANREKWANFLLVKGLKKATSYLDRGGGARCCLGHAAYCLGVTKGRDSLNRLTYGSNCDISAAPAELIALVGLWREFGDTISEVQVGPIDGMYFHSLADANDSTHYYVVGEDKEEKINIRPHMIGEYLLTVIEGGADTPFRPLSEYPEE